MTTVFPKTLAIALALLLVSPPSQATLVYRPAAAQKQSKDLIDREITVRGVFTLLGGSMALVEDPVVYANIGECCGLPFGRFLLLRRSKEVWDVRERYEGATVHIRGRLHRAHCIRREGLDRCYDNQPSLTIEVIQMAADPQRAVALEKRNDLVPVDQASPDTRVLETLAADIHARVSRNDDTGLLSLFATDLYSGYAPDTFRTEYGQPRIASRTHVRALFKELMSEPNGRARWLFFSTEAGPARAAPPTYRLFTKYVPAHEMTAAVVCFARDRSDVGRWPKSIVSLETAKTTDPYVCFDLIKTDGRWWLDFEKAFMSMGRFPPVQ